MKPTVSVITPVYNSEEHLKRCLDSILAQTHSNFELLLIDDGSTDNSREICKAYAQKDKRIRVFHKQNGGPSAARNMGLEKAVGEFVTFIDSDDYIEPQYLQGFFIQNQNPINAIVFQGYIKEYRENEKIIRKLVKGSFTRAEFKKVFSDIELIRLWPHTWGKLYALNILKKQNIFFNPSIHYGEDLIFFLDYIEYASIFILSNHSFYHYLYNSQSVSKSLYGFESEITRFKTVKKKEEKLSKLFDFGSQLRQKHQEHFSVYFYRAFHNLYLKPHKKVKNERIRILKELQDEGNIKYLQNGPWADAKIYKVFRYLIHKRQYRIADSILNIWYKYRFSAFK